GRPVQFLCDKLLIELSVIRAAHALNVERLLFLGSFCIYPKHAKQPISEDELLTGPLEPANEWNAIAKIAGLKRVRRSADNTETVSYRAMPTNLYDPIAALSRGQRRRVAARFGLGHGQAAA